MNQNIIMIVIGVKAKEGKEQFLVPEREYEMAKSTAEACVKAGRAKYKKKDK